jgi:protein-S-isoprenylcysteine O-methyltransferase Ste14
MLFKSPDFLRKRLDAKEKQAAQKGVLAFSGLMFIGSFVVAGLDFRFGWSVMPPWVVITASVLFLLAYGLYAEVMRENAYLSRTIQVEAGQTVVDTGLYGIVRHPMYAATLLLFFMIPLVLGSWYALIVFAFYPVIITVRLLDEERLLTRELPGYAEYKKKVKYRLIPFVW